MAKAGISISVGKSGDDLKQWMRVEITKNPTSQLKRIGEQAVSSLKSSTPRESGTLSEGWDYSVDKLPSGYVLGIYNVAYPEIQGNLALMMDRGHGTRNGGYVHGRNYIRPAIKSSLKLFSVKQLYKK